MIKYNWKIEGALNGKPISASFTFTDQVSKAFVKDYVKGLYKKQGKIKNLIIY